MVYRRTTFQALWFKNLAIRPVANDIELEAKTSSSLREAAIIARNTKSRRVRHARGSLTRSSIGEKANRRCFIVKNGKSTLIPFSLASRR